MSLKTSHKPRARRPFISTPPDLAGTEDIFAVNAPPSLANKVMDGIMPAPAGVMPATNVKWVDLDLIDDNPFQPRGSMDKKELEELIDLINASGQLHPCPARPHRTRAGRFQLAAGHRRKYAVKGIIVENPDGGPGILKRANAGITQPHPKQFVGKLLLNIDPNVSDVEMLARALQENRGRSDIDVLDEAEGYKRLCDMTKGQITLEELAKNHGLTYRHMKRLMDLLDLPEAMQQAIREKKLREQHGRALLRLKTHSDLQENLFNSIKRSEMTGPQADKLATEMLEAEKKRQSLFPPDERSQYERDIAAGRSKGRADGRAARQEKSGSTGSGSTGQSHLQSVPAQAPAETSLSSRVEAINGAALSPSPAAQTSAQTAPGRTEQMFAPDIIEKLVKPATDNLHEAARQLANIDIDPHWQHELGIAFSDLQRALSAISKGRAA